KKAPLVFFQNKAGQAIRCVGGRVDSDSIGTNLRGDRRRVTVHDKFSVLRHTGQKRVSDIEKIIAVLVIKSHTRPYSGMTEEVIADGHRRLKRLQEVAMVLGKTLRKLRLNFFEFTSDHARAYVDTVGVQGFEPAQVAPSLQDSFVIEECHQKFLVIACQGDHRRWPFAA